MVLLNGEKAATKNNSKNKSNGVCGWLNACGPTHRKNARWMGHPLICGCGSMAKTAANASA
jgi:hypothetical protein